MWKIRAFTIQKDFLIDPEKRFYKFFKSRIYNLITAQGDRFQDIMDMLEDDLSRRMLYRDIEYILLRSVFPQDIVVLLLDEKFIDTREYYRLLMEAETSISFRQIPYPHYAVQLYSLDNYVIEGICEAASGDVVFDIGAFDGLTSKKFAGKVGKNGVVYAVEANPVQAANLEREVESYPNIRVVPYAFYDRTEKLPISDNGAGSQLHAGNLSADALPLDDYVIQNKIDKIDFIKMDIEGAELRALLGGVQTIKEHRPKMALCIYHKDGHDLLAIPLFVKKLNLGYRFYVRKFSMTSSETVLFCVPR